MQHACRSGELRLPLQIDLGELLRHNGERSFHHGAGQGCPEAMVKAPSERQGVTLRPVHAKLVRLLEAGCVGACGHQVEDDPTSGFDPDIVD